MEQVRIYDATIYGGGQSPGASLNVEERLEIARVLAQMGVDVIQAGFPIASPRDFQSVRRLASEIKGSAICALARAREEDIDVAVTVLRGAARPRLQIGLGVSDSYIVGKLNTDRETAMAMGVSAVQYARRFVDDVQYYAADACRADTAYLYQVLEAVIAAGASTINIPDAIGFFTPSEWGGLIRGIREGVPNIDQAVISVHCHNDLGMATGNTMEALVNGARQAECAVNGIGERTGCAPLEEVVMAIQARQESLGLTTGLDSRLINPASQLVSHLTGMPIQPNKAIVGDKAFAYTSGMYQDGVLRGRTEAEVLDPKATGALEGTYRISLMTGRDGLRRRLAELGFSLSDVVFESVYRRFREVAKKKPDLDLRDLEGIVSGETTVYMPETYELENVQVTCGTSALPTAAVQMQGPDGELKWATGHGNGPIDAIFNAIDEIVQAPNALLEFTVEALTEGVNALAKVAVRIEGDVPVGESDETEKRIFLGRGADTDTIVATAKAYVFALNRLLAAQRAGRREDAITDEVQREVDKLRAHYGMAPAASDVMGWSILRSDDFF